MELQGFASILVARRVEGGGGPSWPAVGRLAYHVRGLGVFRDPRDGVERVGRLAVYAMYPGYFALTDRLLSRFQATQF